MRRRIISALAICAAVGATAAPASAHNSGTPPGPPEFSGGLGANVTHCMAFSAGPSVVVSNRQGTFGGGTCEIC
jgi:hypothetical protein